MPEPAVILAAEALRKSFLAAGGSRPVIDGLGFAQRSGEFLAIVGPSGCGKTTLLRLLAGLAMPDGGRVLHQSAAASGPAAWISVVFQDYHRSLFPWLTVARNVGFGLRRLERNEQGRRIAAALGAVGLDGFADHYPWQLSGGMQQRVALARAIACRPALLMLDEPFASVDAQTRLNLQDLLMRIWSELRISALLVTHDIDEAVLMADRVLVLTARPARLAAEIEVDLPRPREQLATREHPRFLALRHRIFDLVRGAVGGGQSDRAEAGPGPAQNFNREGESDER